MSGNTKRTLLVLVVSFMVLTVSKGSNGVPPADKEANRAGQRTGRDWEMVQGTPASEAEAAKPRIGWSESRGGEPAVGELNAQPPSPYRPVTRAGWTVYINPTHGFKIAHPSDFVIQVQDVAKLVDLSPTPVFSIFFMNPTMAAGDLAGIEPPDLEVRVYRAEAVDSLQSWLVSVGIFSADSGATAQPYGNHAVRGLEVCHSTMIAPGCSVYVLGGEHVYQLTAISRAGESMIGSFSLHP